MTCESARQTSTPALKFLSGYELSVRKLVVNPIPGHWNHCRDRQSQRMTDFFAFFFFFFLNGVRAESEVERHVQVSNRCVQPGCSSVLQGS